MGIEKIPSNLYAGNAVVVNPMPYVQYAEKREQLKQAKEDALDKYYGNLPNTINDKGLRDQEVEPLHQKQNDIQQYWMQNKEKIRKGNTPEAFNYGKMFRDAQGLVQESKNRATTASKISQLRANSKYDYIFKDPSLLEKIHSHDLPVGSDGSAGIDFNQITLPPPPFDPVKHLGGLKVKPNPDTPTYEPIQGDKYNRLEITGKKFSPEDLNAVHLYAQTQLDNNPSFERQIKEHVEKDPALVAQLAATFQKHYGHPITNEGDVATAYTLSLMDLTPTQKTVRNLESITADKNKEWLRRHNISDRDIRERDKLRAGTYAIDNIPFKLNADKKEVPTFGGGVKVVDITDYPDSYKDDILGGKKNKYGVRINKPIEVGGKEYLKVRPDGTYEGDEGFVVDPKDIIIRTNDRTVKLEKPIGTGKMQIRTDTPKKMKFD